MAMRYMGWWNAQERTHECDELLKSMEQGRIDGAGLERKRCGKTRFLGRKQGLLLPYQRTRGVHLRYYYLRRHDAM